MSAPRKRDSTILLLEKYGDKLRQFSRQQAHLDEQNKAASAPSSAPTVTVSKPIDATSTKPETIATTAPKETNQAPASPATTTAQAAPINQHVDAPKESTQSIVAESAPNGSDKAVEQEKTEEPVPVEASTPAEPQNQQPTQDEKRDVVEEVSKPAESMPAPAVEVQQSSEAPAENQTAALEPSNTVTEEHPVEPSTPAQSSEDKVEPAPEPVVPESPREDKSIETTTEANVEPEQAHKPEDAAEPKSEPQLESKPEEPTPEPQPQMPVEQPKAQIEEHTTSAAVTVPDELEPRQHSSEPEAAPVPEPAHSANHTPTKRKKATRHVESLESKKEEPTPAEVPQIDQNTAAAAGRQVAITSEFFELRWYALLDRVEWTFGYSKLANHRMHLEWDLEDGLDNVQGQTDSLVLKEGEDYIDLNTRLRFSASILVKDLESMRFKPKFITFTLMSDVDNSCMGVCELDLRTIMATGKFDSELRFKLVDLETMKARSTSPTLVMILKRVKLESVSGEKPTKRSDVKDGKPEPGVVPEEEEEVVVEPQERRRERLRREQSTRRRVRKAAIEAEDNGESPSSSTSASPASLSPETTPKKRRGIKILRTNSRFETVEDVDK